MRSLIFLLLRVYVAVEQSRFVRWCLGRKADLILEPLPRPDDDVPQVHEAPSIFIARDGRAAYAHVGATLRRVAQDERGELVYLRKLDKSERKAMKRANKHADRRISAGA